MTPEALHHFRLYLRRHLRERSVKPDLVHLICEIAEASKFVEQAGVAASDGHGPILDLVPTSKDERAPIFIGCKKDVAAEEIIAQMDE
ncbi:MAG: hypothetical protein ABR512_03515 [Desulfopila sp.]